MKFAVICYAVHDQCVVSCDGFETWEDAYEFLRSDARITYDEECDNSPEDERDKIELEFTSANTARLTSSGGKFEWTWELCSISL
jgi:hypothetical protein